jgi:hypothetical protein
MSQTLVGSIRGKSAMTIANLVPIHYQTWPPQAILVSDWLICKQYSSLNPLCEMNQNLVESIPGRLSIQIAHVVPMRS